MRDAQPRSRGVTLRLLDFSAVVADAQAKAAGADETVELSHTPYAAAEVGERLYVVCHEGVGWEVTEDEPLELPLHVRTPSGFSIFPRWNAMLSPSEVRLARTEEEVDLADLVRTFGARLEANFWLWHRTLSGVRA